MGIWKDYNSRGHEWWTKIGGTLTKVGGIDTTGICTLGSISGTAQTSPHLIQSQNVTGGAYALYIKNPASAGSGLLVAAGTGAGGYSQSWYDYTQTNFLGGVQGNGTWNFGPSVGGNITHSFQSNGSTYLLCKSVPASYAVLQLADGTNNVWNIRKAPGAAAALEVLSDAIQTATCTSTGSWAIGNQAAIGGTTYAGNGFVGRTNGTLATTGYVGQVVEVASTLTLTSAGTAVGTTHSIGSGGGQWLINITTFFSNGNTIASPNVQVYYNGSNTSTFGKDSAPIQTAQAGGANFMGPSFNAVKSSTGLTIQLQVTCGTNSGTSTLYYYILATRIA